VRTALVAAAGLLIAGCASSSGGEGTELRFWALGREGEVVQELVRAFERQHPEIRVRVQQMPWTAAHEKLLTAYVGDATPDLTQLGNTWIPELVALDALAPLDSLLAGSRAIEREDFFRGIWETNVIDGTLYGVPWYVDTRVLFYRSDILAEAGYPEPPTTWEEWRQAMQAIKADMGPGEYPLLLPTNEWPPIIIFGMQAGSPLLRDDGRYGGFSGPRFRRAFEFYVSLFRDGLAPVLSNTEVSNLYQEFARGNIAMYMTGPWNIGEFSRRLPPEVQDDWMTAPLPGPGGPGVSMAGGSSIVVFRESRHIGEAWKLIEFLSQPEQQVRFYELSGDLPAHREAWQDSILAGNPYAHAFRQQLERVEPLPKVPEWEQIATRSFERGEEAVRGQATIEEILRALDRDVDRILEKRRSLLARGSSR
jgi:multiple sugar transport system substrate-binding protein